MLKRNWKTLTFWIVAVVLALWIVGTSKAFDSCVHERKNDKTYSALHESPFVIVRAIVRSDLARACAGDFTDKNQGSIAAIATVVVAIFTFTLWRATSGMLSAATDQGNAMERSTAESAKTAAAMKIVADSMLKNVEHLKETLGQLKESVATSKRIADQQKIISAMQLRAYLSVTIGSAAYQDRANEIYFQASANLISGGSTPAAKVRHKIAAGIFPVPLPTETQLPLPAEYAGEDMIPPNQPRTVSFKLADFCDDADIPDIKRGKGKGLYIWGAVSYEDAFGQLHETNFCHRLTWLQDGRIWGYYIAGRNTMT